MSLQAGIWNFAGQPIDPNSIAQLGVASLDRGRDGQSSLITGNLGMLYKPFYTTAESRREKQPHKSYGGFTVTWDGRLDNRDELIADLGSNLKSATDVEIAAIAFDYWGTDCFKRLNGDWAISFWDQRHRTLTLAVDHAGIKHLYYSVRPTQIIWCSDLPALTQALQVPLSLDRRYVAGYLVAYPEAHLTAFSEISSVDAGHFVSICNNKVESHRYWTFNPNVTINYGNDREYEDHFRFLFRQAVRRRLRSDSPILAELSGGLDSSSIVCMADDIVTAESTQYASVDTFSAYDSREPSGDERPYFAAVERKRGRTGFHFDTAQSSVSFTATFPRLFAAPGYVSTANGSDTYLNELIEHGGYRVILSGTGGDEFLGGVPDPRSQLADLISQYRFSELWIHLSAWSLIKRKPWINLLAQSLTLLLPSNLQLRLRKEAAIAPWIDDSFARQYRLAELQLGISNTSEFQLPSKKDYASTFISVTRQLAYRSLFSSRLEERRYPYLDKDLIEFLIAIPDTQLLRPGERRSLMRRAFKDLLPTEVLHRKTKAVSARRHMASLEAESRTLEVIANSPICGRMGFVKSLEIRAALQKARHGNVAQLLRLMKVLALEFWLRDIISRGLLRVEEGCSSNEIAAFAKRA